MPAFFIGCAGHPLVARRAALDDQPEPAKSAPAESTSIPPKTEAAQSSAPVKPEPAAPVVVPEKLPADSTAKSTAAPRTEAGNQESVVVISTSFGSMVIELDERAAPKTAANFEKLALQGFYNRTTFHRVIPGFMIQGGDPNSKNEDHSLYGIGGPGYTIPAEIGLSPVRGAVAMARLPDTVNPRKDSSGSQFFICVADCPQLQGGYTVFGRVIKGLEVADKIAASDRDDKDCPLSKIEMQASLASKSKALESAN